MSKLADLIRHDTPISVGAEAAYPYSAKLERQYVFTSRYGEEVPLHRVEGNLIYLPRALCPVGGEDLRTDGQPVVFPKMPVPRSNQEKVFSETAAFLKLGQSGLVVAYTGWGKTVLGYYAAAVCGVKTLVVTTKDDIYQQWLDGACGRVSESNPDGVNFLGLDWSEVGEIRKDKCEIIGTKFVVAMIHSLSKDNKYPPEVMKMMNDDFGLVIFDECHRLPAEQFSAVATMFRARRRLGLTATFDRSDGKEVVLQAHIGPIRAATEEQLMIPKVLRIKTAWQCPRVPRTDKTTGKVKIIRLPHEAGKTVQVEKSIAADPVRNHQIVEAIKAAYDKGRRVVVFSTLIDHLHTMHNAASKMGIPGKAMGYYIGAHTKAELEAREQVKARPVIFTTYTMMAEGTNIPWLDTCVIAMPRAKVAQSVGRIRREYEDKRFPLVLDFLDYDSPIFEGYADSRRKWYNSIGCEVVDMTGE